ncbi:hypothetical protein OKW46_002873 [Paraburkholderia sp. WSM4179]|nr:hypothetical protein [Paraburkholderia sp. WSM4179]
MLAFIATLTICYAFVGVTGGYAFRGRADLRYHRRDACWRAPPKPPSRIRARSTAAFR